MIKNKEDFIMRKEKDDNVKKSEKVTFGETDKWFKCRFRAASKEEQERMRFDIPQEADEWDIEVTRQANEWLRDGQPVN